MMTSMISINQNFSLLPNTYILSNVSELQEWFVKFTNCGTICNNLMPVEFRYVNVGVGFLPLVHITGITDTNVHITGQHKKNIHITGHYRHKYSHNWELQTQMFT